MPAPDDILYCSSGTEALFLLLSYLRDAKGCKRVLLSPFTCESVLESVTASRLHPVFVDFVSDSLSIDVKDLQRKAIAGTEDIVLYTHLFGFSPGYAEVNAFCRDKKVFLIEDCAHLIMDWVRTGACQGDAAFFSFGLSKPLNIGKGGTCWIRKEMRDEFLLYANSLPSTEIGTIPAIITLVSSYIRTNPVLLDAAVAFMSKEKSTPIARPYSEHRLRLDEWTRLNSFQISLIEKLLSIFAPMQRMRREMLATYEKNLKDLYGVQFLCGESALLANNAPVRVPLIVSAEQRDPLLRASIQNGLWTSTWIHFLISSNCSNETVCHQAADILKRIIALPVGFSHEEMAIIVSLRKQFQAIIKVHEK